MKDNPFVQLKFTRGECVLLAVLDTYQGEKAQSCKWIIKVLKQQLECNGINPTKLSQIETNGQDTHRNRKLFNSIPGTRVPRRDLCVMLLYYSVMVELGFPKQTDICVLILWLSLVRLIVSGVPCFSIMGHLVLRQ